MSRFSKTLIPGLIATTAVGLLAFLVVASLPAFGSVSDFAEYYAAAKLVLSGHGDKAYALTDFVTAEQLFFPELKGRIVGFFVPPFSMAWIVPIGLFPLPAALIIWKLKLIAALFASIFILSKTFVLDRTGVLWLVAACGLSGAVYEGLRIDQLATILLVAFSIALYGLKKDRPVIAGFGLSLLMLKPQELLPFLIFLLAVKQYRTLLWFAAFSAIVAIVGFCELGISGLQNYSTLMASTVQDNRFLVSDLSPSLRGQLLRILPNDRALASIAGGAFLMLSLAAIFVTGRKFANSKYWLEAGLIFAVPLGMVSCLYFFDYDLVLLIPTLIVLMQNRIQDHIPPPILALGMLGALIYFVPFSIYIHYYYLLPGGVVNPYFVTLLVFSMLTLVFVFKRSDLFD